MGRYEHLYMGHVSNAYKYDTNITSSYEFQTLAIYKHYRYTIVPLYHCSCFLIKIIKFRWVINAVNPVSEITSRIVDMTPRTVHILLRDISTIMNLLQSTLFYYNIENNIHVRLSVVYCVNNQMACLSSACYQTKFLFIGASSRRLSPKHTTPTGNYSVHAIFLMIVCSIHIIGYANLKQP